MSMFATSTKVKYSTATKNENLIVNTFLYNVLHLTLNLLKFPDKVFNM